MERETKITDMNLLGAFICESIENGREVNLTVTGDSMYPLFKSRVDTVVLNKPQKLKKRDIAFYKRDNGSYILHRILKIKGDNLMIAGDNELKKEYPVRKEQVIGVVKSFTRKGEAHTVDELWYKIYSFIWCVFFPIRPLILRFLLKLVRLKVRRRGK